MLLRDGSHDWSPPHTSQGLQEQCDTTSHKHSIHIMKHCRINTLNVIIIFSCVLCCIIFQQTFILYDIF